MGPRYGCAQCESRRSLFFRGAVAACRYQDTAREMVHRLKYQGDLRAVNWMGEEITRRLRRTEWFEEVEVIAPVPLHWTRRAARRFNQSKLLARAIARESGKRLAGRVLRRTRRTRPQAFLPASERVENVRGAFGVRRPERVRGRSVLLVDDVMTTCATASECARALVKAGAGRVHVAVFAR